MKQTKKTLKKFSTATLTTISHLSPEELEAHGIIQPARASGYVCPECNSGDGSKGTGMTQNPKIEDATVFHCFGCGSNFNVLSLCSLHYNLDTHSDFQALVEKICADFDIHIEYEDFAFHSSSRTSTRKTSKPEPLDPKELKNIQDDLDTSIEPLKRFIENQPNKLWRGFNLDFLLSHNCRLIWDWVHPKYKLIFKSNTPTARMIIPNGNASYLARLIDTPSHYDAKVRLFIHEKEHAGHKKIFNPDALQNDIVFVVEGYLDAMSLELAGFNAVALGGCAEGHLLLDAIDKLDNPSQIILLLDSDDAGKKAAKNLRELLLQIKCPCCIRYLTAPKKDCAPLDCISGSAVLVGNKIDANHILQKYGIDVLRSLLQDILDHSLSELDAIAHELAKKDNAGLSQDDWDSIFSGNHSDLTFAKRLEIFCAGKVHWIIDSERWILYNNGLWQLGSEKNSCVSPLARRFADALIQNASTKSERDLADKFQSAKKISAAITLLKAHDSILITQDDLDKHPQLLNCLNCVVDLSDGKTFSHAPELLLSQQVQAAYFPNTKAALVDKFFVDIIPDEMTRAGLLRWLGYCLTGENSAEKFMIWHGGGKNGKGVLSATTLALLGAYGVGLTPRALLKSNRPVDPNAATVALNALENARFAISEEMPADGELDISLIKNLTGGDRINLRRNYGEYRTLINVSKLNLSGNYLPKIENISDFGLLRRILNMPFSVQFGTAEHPCDEHLKKKLLLLDNLNALLTLLVSEAVAWYRDGLIISPAMQEETKRHLSQNDFVEDFICDNYERASECSIKAKDLIDALRREYPRETSRFKRADLIKLVENVDGITYCVNRNNCRVFTGIKPVQ